MQATRKRTLVVAALVRDADKVLMSRRRADQPMPLLWEFPGGKVEPGEHPHAALVREVVEKVAGSGRVTDELRTMAGGLFRFPSQPTARKE